MSDGAGLRAPDADGSSVPDDLLWDIFLRLSDPADLVRTSASCVSFRSLIADNSFLRQYRKLHAPPFLGFLEQGKVFHPAISPHPSASAASAVALAADFSFSFLPAPVPTSNWGFQGIHNGRILLGRGPEILPAPGSDWVLQDVRDGRVLLSRDPMRDIDDMHIYAEFPELVVSDPLHRRYLLLPSIPAHLAASVENPLVTGFRWLCEIFLAPAGGGDEEISAAEEMSFRVIWMVQCSNKLVAFVFSSNTGQWRASLSESWSNLFDGLLSSTWTKNPFFFRQYAYSCFYWMTQCTEKLLVLDTRRMEFSIADPPPEALGLPFRHVAFVEAGEGRLGMFVLAEDTSYLKFSIRRNSCVSPNHWQFEKIISLDSKCSFMGSVGSHLFLYHPGSPSHDAGCFSLDVNTLQFERVFVSSFDMPYGYTYSNFPPSLLLTPTISSVHVEVEAGEEERLDYGSSGENLKAGGEDDVDAFARRLCLGTQAINELNEKALADTDSEDAERKYEDSLEDIENKWNQEEEEAKKRKQQQKAGGRVGVKSKAGGKDQAGPRRTSGRTDTVQHTLEKAENLLKQNDLENLNGVEKGVEEEMLEPGSAASSSARSPRLNLGIIWF